MKRVLAMAIMACIAGMSEAGFLGTLHPCVCRGSKPNVKTQARPLSPREIEKTLKRYKAPSAAERGFHELMKNTHNMPLLKALASGQYSMQTKKSCDLSAIQGFWKKIKFLLSGDKCISTKFSTNGNTILQTTTVHPCCIPSANIIQDILRTQPYTLHATNNPEYTLIKTKTEKLPIPTITLQEIYQQKGMNAFSLNSYSYKQSNRTYAKRAVKKLKKELLKNLKLIYTKEEPL